DFGELYEQQRINAPTREFQEGKSKE
ncbi:hypothetical protein CCACVL1_06176, partial [Corchorus capsularis]